MDPTGNCSSYLPAMTSDITQMVFSMSHWASGDLSWMQHDSCSGSCQSNATQTFSNLKFYTTNINPPDNTDNYNDDNSGDNGASTDYTWGDACNNLTDGLCYSVDCVECLYSWPSSSLLPDPWNDPDAACRCKSERGQDNNDNSGDNDASTDYTWGDACNNLTDGLCGSVDCGECLYSWPSSSLLPDPWNDPDAACRCKTERGQDDNDDNSQPTISYTFGDACMDLTEDDCADVDCAVCRMSWPTDTMFDPTTDDPEAMCRCEIEVDPARPEPTDFTYGDDCASLTAGECGNVDCEVCSSSWPTDSPYLFPETQDPLSMCRCQQEAPAQMPDPIQETQYIYDYECTAESTDDMSLCADGCNCHISWAIDSP